jgi:hypothetical protein
MFCALPSDTTDPTQSISVLSLYYACMQLNLHFLKPYNSPLKKNF